MIIFLVGSSSVGKSTLLQWLRRHSTPSPIILNADDFYGAHRQRLVELAEKGRVSWDVFQNGKWIEGAHQAWHHAIVAAGKGGKPVFVDTVFRNLQSDLDALARHAIAYRLVMVGVDLQSLLRNIKARADDRATARSPAAVLGEVASLYRPAKNGPMTFHRADLDAFRKYGESLPPYGWMRRRLPSTLRKFEKQFFPKQEPLVRVEPAVPFHIDLFVEHNTTPTTGRTIQRRMGLSTHA